MRAGQSHLALNRGRKRAISLSVSTDTGGEANRLEPLEQPPLPPPPSPPRRNDAIDNPILQQVSPRGGGAPVSSSIQLSAAAAARVGEASAQVSRYNDRPTASRVGEEKDGLGKLSSTEKSEQEEDDVDLGLTYAAYAVYEELVNEILSAEVVPDILIEILTHDGEDYKKRSEEEALAIEIFEQIQGVVVHSLVEDVVSMIEDFLRERRSPDPHPLLLLVNNLLNQGVQELMVEMMTEAIRELVSEYLIGQKVEVLLGDVIYDLATEVVSSTLFDLSVEDATQAILIEVVKAEVRGIAENFQSEKEHSDLEVKRAADKLAIMKGMEHIFHSACFRLLIGNIANSGERIALKECLADKLDTLITERLFALLYLMNRDRQVVARNGPILSVHSSLTAKAAYKVLLSLLMEEIEHLEEEELDMEFGK